MDEEVRKTVRRPMNAFLIFCKRHRSKERNKNPNLDNRTITRLLGDKWAKLPPQDKSFYTNLARENKEAFLKNHPNYKWRRTEKSSKSSASARSSGKGVGKGSGSSSSKSKAKVGGVNLLLMADKKTSDEHRKKTSSSVRPKAASSAKSTSTKKRGVSKAVKEAKKSSVQISSVEDSTSALLQLAEMCTSELYSSVPNKATNTQASPPGRLSSPLPPPKKRARQWSIDCSQDALGHASQKADSEDQAKHTSKKSESSSGQRKQKNVSKNVQSSAPSQRESRQISWKPDRQSKDIYLQPLGGPPMSQTKTKTLHFSSKEHFSPAPMAAKADCGSLPARAEVQQLPGRPPPHMFTPLLTQMSTHFTHDNEPSPHIHRPQPDHSWRDLPEKALDFSKTSDKKLGNAKFVHEHMPSRSEGTIASLLSSPFPFSKYDGGCLKPDVVDTKANITSNVTVTSQTLEKFPVIEPSPSPTSCVRDINVPSGNTAQPFTEGKLKKKWTQRMMVEAKEKEDIARQIAGSVESPQPPHLDPVGLVAHIKTENSEHENTCPVLPADKTQFRPCKTEFKSEPTPLFSNGKDSEFPKPDICNNQHVFSSTSSTSSSTLSLSSSSYSHGKPEALQSNTLYRALMGQAPSHLCLSSHPANHPTSNSFNNNNNLNSENLSLKLEENKQVFTPIAACGKKMMDHIVELFQSGFSADPNNPEPSHGPLADGVDTHTSGLPAVSVDLAQSLASSVVTDRQGSLSLTTVSPSSLVEKVVSEMFQADPSLEACNEKKTKTEIGSFSGQGRKAFLWKDANNQPTCNDGIKKEKREAKPNEQCDFPPDAMEDPNSTELAEDVIQPVRKSRRANRGQKYQALIKEGIIQPSKERMAARNLERNIRSCSSREELDRVEAKKVLKRSYSEREGTSLPAGCDSRLASVPGDRLSPIPAKKICLDKENVSLPTGSSVDQSDKKKVAPLRSQSESSMTVSKSNIVRGSTSHTQASKASGLSEPVKKESGLGKVVNTKPASCPSLQELGCHTVHLPLIKEEIPPESFTGSRKRKARRHCITRISVVPSSGKKRVKRKTILPAMIPNYEKNDSDKGNVSSSSHKQETCIKSDRGGMKNHKPLEPQGISSPGGSSPTPFLHHSRHNPHIHHNFPALTLLSSVMIDSEKAISPACQSEAPNTTQSPTPAALARTGVETTQLAANRSDLLPSYMPLASSSCTSAPIDPLQAARWLMGVQAASLRPQSSPAQGFPNKTPGSLFSDLQRSAESSVAAESSACKSKLFDLSSAAAIAQRSAPPSSWPMPEAPLPYSSTPTITPAFSSSHLTKPLNNAPNNTTTAATQATKRPAASTGVLSPFVISTLPPSTKADTTSCTWSKSVTPSSSSSSSASAPTRKKKSHKVITDEKVKPGVNSYAAVTQKTLNPSTKKLVKLLLKGDNMEDTQPALKSGQDVCVPTTASSQQPIEAKQETASLAHRPSDQATARRPPPKAAMSDIAATAAQRGVANSPLYLSLNSHLEAGQVISCDKQPGVKKRKPTIWDHLNSPGCLPISKARNPQNVIVSAVKKKGQERVISTMNRVTGQKKNKSPRVNTTDMGVKASHKERNGSDTESASEDSAGHASDTDSAEERESVSPNPSAHKNSLHPTVSHPNNPTRLPIMPFPNTPRSSGLSASGQCNSPLLPSSLPSSCHSTPVTTSTLRQTPPKSGGLFTSVPSATQPYGQSVPVPLTSNTNAGHPVNQTVSVSQPSRTAPKLSDDPNALPRPSVTLPLPFSRISGVPTASPFQQAITVSAKSLPTQPASTPVSSHAPVYLPVVVTTLEDHPSGQDVSRPVYKQGYAVSVAPHPPRIPTVTSYPSSSANVDTVVFNARTTSPLMEGGATHVSSSPHLPGSPSVAAVQS